MVEAVARKRSDSFFCPFCDNTVKACPPWTHGQNGKLGSAHCQKCNKSLSIGFPPTGYFLGFPYWSNHMHDYKEVAAESIGKQAWNCYHYYKCMICGDVREIDTSG